MQARPAIELSRFDRDITVLKLVGEHDLSSKKALAERLQKPVCAGERVIVDLSETEFIDCSVLTSLIEADRLARRRGLGVALQLKPSTGVARVLEMAGLTRRLFWAASREEAARLARRGNVSSSDGNGTTGG
jgi:anti-anti-sigma factor